MVALHALPPVWPHSCTKKQDSRDTHFAASSTF